MSNRSTTTCHSDIVFLNGEFLPADQAKIPIHNRGFLFGDGVYATIQVKDGRPLFLDIHLERLKNQAKHFKLQPPDIQRDTIYKFIELNGAHQGIWKLKIMVVAGEESEMFFPPRKAPYLIFLMHPFTPAPYAPLKLAHFPTPLMTAHTSFKSLAHLSRYFVMDYALTHSCDDGYTTTENGIILEAAFGNLFWVSGDSLFTPDPKLPLHFGVTISHVVEMAHEMGLKVVLVKQKLDEIPKNSALYRCNTMSGIRPISHLGERKFERHLPLEDQLLARYVTVCRRY